MIAVCKTLKTFERYWRVVEAAAAADQAAVTCCMCYLQLPAKESSAVVARFSSTGLVISVLQLDLSRCLEGV